MRRDAINAKTLTALNRFALTVSEHQVQSIGAISQWAQVTGDSTTVRTQFGREREHALFKAIANFHHKGLRVNGETAGTKRLTEALRFGSR